jgi:hypothetical protein
MVTCATCILAAEINTNVDNENRSLMHMKCAMCYLYDV